MIDFVDQEKIKWDFRTSYDPWNVEGNFNPGCIERMIQLIADYFLQGKICQDGTCPIPKIKESRPSCCPFEECHVYRHGTGIDGNYHTIMTRLEESLYRIKISIPQLIISLEQPYIIRTGFFNNLAIDHKDGNECNNLRENLSLKLLTKHTGKHSSIRSLYKHFDDLILEANSKTSPDFQSIQKLLSLFKKKLVDNIHRLDKDDIEAWEMIARMNVEREMFPSIATFPSRKNNKKREVNAIQNI